MAKIELTTREVSVLIERQVDKLHETVRQMHSTPIRSKQEALPIIARINELLELIPDPSVGQPLEMKF